MQLPIFHRKQNVQNHLCCHEGLKFLIVEKYNNYHTIGYFTKNSTEAKDFKFSQPVNNIL